MKTNKIEITVDDYVCDPQFIIEADENPELRELILECWELEPPTYAILVGHGITVQYLKILDEKALNDIFSVAKWTGHKYALRKKLSEWEESALFRQAPLITEIPPDSKNVGAPGTSKHKLLPTSVTNNLLDDILKRNEKGKIITQFYQAHKCLDSEHRKSLAHTIVDYYIANQLFFPLPDMARFAQLISERFSPEIPETYYNPRDCKVNKKNPSGLIYDRFHNRNKKALVKPKSVDVIFLQELRTKALELPADEVERLTSLKNWMRNNSEPRDQILQHWKESLLLRMRSILQDEDLNKQNTITEWPRLTDKSGYLLVDADFDFMHDRTDKPSKLFDNWGKFTADFKEYIRINNVKDDLSRSLVTFLDDPDLPQDARDYIVSSVFHAVIKPVRTSKRKLPTILQAQIDVCYVCDTQEEYVEALKSLRDEFASNNLHFSPRIYAIGKPDRLETFYVVTQTLEYQLPSFLRCLDVVIKLKCVLDFQYPESCELFWCFISQYFYDINYARKSKNTQLLQLFAYLKTRDELPPVQGTA